MKMNWITPTIHGPHSLSPFQPNLIPVTNNGRCIDTWLIYVPTSRIVAQECPCQGKSVVHL